MVPFVLLRPRFSLSDVPFVRLRIFCDSPEVTGVLVGGGRQPFTLTEETSLLNLCKGSTSVGRHPRPDSVVCLSSLILSFYTLVSPDPVIGPRITGRPFGCPVVHGGGVSARVGVYVSMSESTCVCESACV